MVVVDPVAVFAIAAVYPPHQLEADGRIGDAGVVAALDAATEYDLSARASAPETEARPDVDPDPI